MNRKKKSNTEKKSELTQGFNHEFIQITAVLQPGVDHRQIDLSLLDDGHSESRISSEFIDSSKSLDVPGQVALNVDNLIPVIKVSQRPAIPQVRKSIEAIRRLLYLPADSSTVPDTIGNVCLSGLTVPALSEDPPVGFILVTVQNIDLVVDEQTNGIEQEWKILTSYW